MYLRAPKIILLLVVLLGWGGLGLRAQVSETKADADLRELMGRQRDLLGQAERAEVQEDVEALRPRLQTLVFDFERHLRTYPKQVEGYIGYSMLLGNPLLDERDRAKALLLKANTLNPDIAVVKNQLGKYLAEDGRPLEALNYFLSAVQLEPDQSLYHLQIGQLLGAARADFLQSGEWAVDQVDRAMMHAFAEAVRLDPDNVPYAYRQAEAYYDLHEPPWEEALAKWRDLEARVETDLERQMIRLHQANVRLFQGELDAAEALLDAAVEAPLAAQRASLLGRLNRLRHPELATATPGLAPGAEPKVEVPEFRPMEPTPAPTLSSAGVLAITDEDPAAALPPAAPATP